MPWWSKVCFPFLLLGALIIAPFLKLRELILDINDDKGQDQSDDHLLDKFMAPYRKFIIDDRDLFLRMVLAEEIIEEKNNYKRLCVKYGAKHMSGLAESLLKDFDYELTRQRSVLAIAKNKSASFKDMNTGYNVAIKKLQAIIKAKKERKNLAGNFGEILPQKVTYKDNQPIKIPLSLHQKQGLKARASLRPLKTTTNLQSKKLKLNK